MKVYKCPWCSSKSSYKSTVESHMKICSRRPRTVSRTGSSHSTYSSSDNSDFLTDLAVIETVAEIISDFSSSSSTDYGSTSGSSDSFSGGGGDSGGGGASSDW